MIDGSTARTRCKTDKRVWSTDRCRKLELIAEDRRKRAHIAVVQSHLECSRRFVAVNRRCQLPAAIHHERQLSVQLGPGFQAAGLALSKNLDEDLRSP